MLINTKKQRYYEDHWSSVIIRIMRYKHPLIANIQSLTSHVTKSDPSNPIYFHIDWLKPGKHYYVVNHDNENVYSSGEEG